MPIVTASPRSNSNGEQVTEFLDTINTTPTTYTFLNTQERLKVKNNGYGSFQLTVNGSVVTVLPSESKEFYGSIDSFVISSNGGVQSFEVVGTNYKDEEFQLTGRNVQQEVAIQNAVTAVGNGTAIDMGGADTFKITEISGTSTSRTIIFEVSNAENGTYSPVQAVRLSDLAMASQVTANNEVWQIDGLAGLWFRARVSAVAGGNLTVKGKVVA